MQSHQWDSNEEDGDVSIIKTHPPIYDFISPRLIPLGNNFCRFAKVTANGERGFLAAAIDSGHEWSQHTIGPFILVNRGQGRKGCILSGQMFRRRGRVFPNHSAQLDGSPCVFICCLICQSNEPC